MAYKHVAVADIVRTTTNRLAKLAEQVNTVNPTDAPVQMIDGLPCSPALAQFAQAIRKTNRHVKFGITGKAKYLWQSERHLELFVYMEGDMYAMARIGHADYTVGKESITYKFMVESRTINNEKYRDNRDEYHMALTDTLDRAVKNVSKHMRRYSPLEVAAISYEKVRSYLRSPGIKAGSKLYEAKCAVRDHSHLQTELIILLDSGYSFLSYELRNAVMELRDAQKEDTEARDMAKPCYFIIVRLQNDDMMCDVVRLHSFEDIRQGTDSTVTYKMEDLPEELAGRIAVLSMVEDDQYVDNVGLRVNSSTFWVHA